MKHNLTKYVSSAFMILSIAMTSGCLEKKDEALEPSLDGGGGSLFTANDISNGSSKTWSSDCVAYADATLGTTYYKQVLTLQSNGAFSFQHYAYTNPGTNQLSPCANPDYKTVFLVAGAYSVGSEIVTGVQAILFVPTTSNLMVVDSLTTNHTATQDIFNTDCGGTSPYCTLVNQACTNNGVATGSSRDSSHMLCQHYTFASANSNIYNAASYSSGVLTLGAGTTGLPGVMNANSIPQSLSVVFH